MPLETVEKTKDRVPLGTNDSSSDRAVLTYALIQAYFRVRGAVLAKKVLKVLELWLFLSFPVSEGLAPKCL